MHQQLDTLQQKMEVIKQFENLFSSNNSKEFDEKLGSDKLPGTFFYFMKDDARKKAAQAFGDCEVRVIISILEHIKGSSFATNDDIKSPEAETHSLPFVNQVIIAMQQYNGEKNASKQYVHARDNHIMRLRDATINLIASQKAAIQRAIEDARQAKMPASAEKLKRFVKHKVAIANPQVKAAVDGLNDFKKAKGIAEAHSKQVPTTQFRKKIARYTGAATLATVGTGAVVFSSLMQFSPQLVLLAGLHLPPVALASVAVSGVAMLAAGAYVAYRTYKPAPLVVADDTDAAVNPNPVVGGYSKALTTALIASGLHLTAFSAMVHFAPTLMQFSPKFALLMGLHLSPVALMSIAAVGVLLISVGLYRACKAYAQSRADAAPAPVVVTDADVQPSPTCLQRLSQYSTCCFKFGRGTAAANTATTENSEEIAAKLK